MTTNSPPERLPPGTRIGRSALRVSDLDVATDFYRDIVGLEAFERAGTSAVLGVGETPLLHLESTDAERGPESAGLYHVAFRVPSRGALGDALGRIRDRWHLEGASDHRVSEALYLTDPDGNGVEIYRDFPREDWPTTDDGRVQMGTDRLDVDGVAADAAGRPGLPAESDIGHVHLEVASLDAFRSWFVDTVGFEWQQTMPGATFVSAGGYHHHVGANTWNHRSAPADERGLDYFEVVLPGESALEALRGRLERNGDAMRETDEGFAVTGPDAIEVRFRIEESG